MNFPQERETRPGGPLAQLGLPVVGREASTEELGLTRTRSLRPQDEPKGCLTLGRIGNEATCLHKGSFPLEIKLSALCQARPLQPTGRGGLAAGGDGRTEAV